MVNKLQQWTVAVVLAGMCVPPLYAQDAGKKVNDSNTPLHLLQPDYAVPYGPVSPEQVKSDLDRVRDYLLKATPAQVEDKNSHKPVTDYKRIDANSQLVRGDFRLAAYEWGVTYAGMVRAAEVTKDKSYADYAIERMKFLAAVAPHFRKLLDGGKAIDPQMRQILTPHALDDAGAVCAAMIKVAHSNGLEKELRPLIDNYMDFILNKEFRLADGTFARKRPYHNTLWLDDMYMSLPAIVQMGKLTGDTKYYDETVRQVKQFAERMFIPEKGLFRHGWVESMQDHPAFCWGRANGWALLTMCEVLDVLPENHPGRPEILELLRSHVRGLAACQGGEGFWHQLLDRPDSYLETSATAIFVYGISHAINRGWIDALAYAPVAQLGWAAVSTKINAEGQVEGTCVGTGMGYDPAFYYHRPVNKYAAHGYGPVLLAGAEMIELLNRHHPKMNDSAVLYYGTPQATDKPIFEETK